MKTSGEARALLRYLERPGRGRFDRLVRACQGFVYATALRVTRNPEDALDISQDVFLGLLLDPPAPGAVKSPRAFLAWRVVGRASNRRRAEERRRERESRGRELARDDGVAGERLEALHAAVEALPEELRLPIELRYFAGVSNRDIAVTLGLSVRAVEERLRNARDRLRRRLAPNVLGLLAVATPLDRFAADVPSELSLNLLRVARRGMALRALLPLGTSLQAGTLGGALMAKKIALAVGVVIGVAALVSVVAPPRTTRAPGSPSTDSMLSLGEAPAALPPRDGTQTSPAPIDPAGPRAPEPDRATLRGLVWDDEETLVPAARVVFRQRIDADGAEELRAAGYTVEPGVIETETASDEAGEYVLAALLPHKGRLEVEKDPYILCHPMHGARPEAGTATRSDVHLCRPHRVFGNVRSASGGKLHGARVLIDGDVLRRLDASGNYEPWREFPTGENGDYDTGAIVPVVRILDSDPLVVIAVADGHTVVRKKIHREEFQSYEGRVDFVLGAEMAVLVLVTDPRGLPVEGVTLSVNQDASPLGEKTHTGADGRGRIEHLSPGEVRVYLSKQGYFQRSLLVDEEASRNVEVVLRPWGPPVSGRVLLDERLPEPEREPGDLVFEKVRPDGRFENKWQVPREFDRETLSYRFFPPEPGRYSIRRERGLVVARTEPFEYDGVRSMSIDLAVRLEPPYVSGIVVWEDSGEAVADVAVTARFVGEDEPIRSTWHRTTIVDGFAVPCPPGNRTETRTDASGRFLLVLPKVPFNFWSPRSNRVSLSGSTEAAATNDFEFVFDDETVIEGIRLELVPMGVIAGDVLTAQGEPSVGEVVLASNVEGTTRWTRTDRDGRFLLEKLPAGDYFLEALGAGPSPRTGSGSGAGFDASGLPPPHAFFARPVKVRPGEVTEWRIDLRRDGLGKIHGRAGAGTTPLEELHVEYGMIVLGTPRNGGCLGGGVPVVEGRFELENLLPGRYRVALQAADRVLDETEVIVGRSTTLDVQLTGEMK